MKRAGTGLGYGLLALLPIACCVGLPLIVAAGLSVAAVAVIGGIALGAVALVVALSLLALRVRTRNRRGSIAILRERTTR